MASLQTMTKTTTIRPVLDGVKAKVNAVREIGSREESRFAQLQAEAPGASMSDPTEPLRRFLIDNDVPANNAAQADVKYDTAQLREHFTVHGFLAPFVTVTRKADGVKGVKGVMMFTHHPRMYFNFEPEG